MVTTLLDFADAILTVFEMLFYLLVSNPLSVVFLAVGLALTVYRFNLRQAKSTRLFRVVDLIWKCMIVLLIVVFSIAAYMLSVL